MKRTTTALAALAVALAATACGGGSGGGSAATGSTPAGPVKITIWHGQIDVAQKAIDAAIVEFNASHPGIVVTSDTGGTTADHMMEKVQAGLAADAGPDISYLFGSQLANIVQTGKVADLSDLPSDAAWNWSDFWPAERDAVTVDGKVRAVPALIDNFGVIYNKKLLAAAGIAEPTADWTWSDFRAAAKKLTDPGKGIYGSGYPIDGSEDTAVRFLWMLWQQGGDLLSADGTQSTFATDAGVRALETWRAMAVDDRSMYLDAENTGKIEQLFNAGKVGFFVTGPWELAVVQQAKVDYGVQVLPGTNGSHTTVAGPDTWVVYDKGAARVAAAKTFLQWFTSPAESAKWSVATGSLPIRASTQDDPAFATFFETYPGNEVFVKNLANATKAKPRVTALPQVFDAVGEAVVATLLGKKDVQGALNEAAANADGALAGG
jgi:multiple sugar transport system substrate-binding protein